VAGMDVFHQNYCKLLQLVPSLHEVHWVEKLSAPQHKNIDVSIQHRHHKKATITITHYRTHPSGDMIQDLCFTIAIYLGNETVEVLTYQDCFGYRQVYSNDMMAFSPSIKAELNNIFSQWLTILLNQSRAGVP
jgi:uncharacterized protein YqiB (DUF1249 family)